MHQSTLLQLVREFIGGPHRAIMASLQWPNRGNEPVHVQSDLFDQCGIRPHHHPLDGMPDQADAEHKDHKSKFHRGLPSREWGLTVLGTRTLVNLPSGIGRPAVEAESEPVGRVYAGPSMAAMRSHDHRRQERPTPQTEGKTIRWARLYDLGTSLLSFGQLAALHRTIVDLAAIRVGEQILDVGCGPGRLAIMAGRAGGPSGAVAGIDPAPEMIALARRKADQAGVRARFDVGVIESLPYPADSFDVVLGSLMLHHLPDALKSRGFGEIRRVLKPGGRLVAVDFGATPRGALGHLLCVLRIRTGSDHAEYLRALLRAAGFERGESGPTGHRGLAFVRGWKPRATRA